MNDIHKLLELAAKAMGYVVKGDPAADMRMCALRVAAEIGESK